MKRQSGFTLIELLVVVALMGILAAMAVMSLLRSKSAANEASAIASVRAIGSAQLAYSSSCGRGFYATDLTTLGVPPPGGADPFISPDLSGTSVVQKAGYQIQMAPAASAQGGVADCNGTPTQTAYYVRAEPLTFGVNGNRSFATTSSVLNSIWMAHAGTAPSEPFASPSLPLQ